MGGKHDGDQTILSSSFFIEQHDSPVHPPKYINNKIDPKGDKLLCSACWQIVDFQKTEEIPQAAQL